MHTLILSHRRIHTSLSTFIRFFFGSVSFICRTRSMMHKKMHSLFSRFDFSCILSLIWNSFSVSFLVRSLNFLFCFVCSALKSTSGLMCTPKTIFPIHVLFCFQCFHFDVYFFFSNVWLLYARSRFSIHLSFKHFFFCCCCWITTQEKKKNTRLRVRVRSLCVSVLAHRYLHKRFPIKSLSLIK